MSATVAPIESNAAQNLGALFGAQRASLREGCAPNAELRIDRLKRALNVIVKNENRIIDAMSADFGHRSADQSFFVEIVTTAKPLKEAIRNVRKWMRPSRRHLDVPFALAGAKAHVRYQPLGVVGCISPWNFPVNLTFAPLAGILAAGNRAMLKPSEATPASAALIAELVKEAFDPTEVTVATGGPDVSSAFSALPFDHLLYTGGEAVAKKIARAASENLTPLTLELGGKSPVIFGETVKLDLAAQRLMFGKFLNAGQVCLAPDYLLVKEEQLDDTIVALKAAVEKSAPMERAADDFVSIINERHAARLRSYLKEAKDAGAEIISFDWLSSGEGNIVPPALIVNPGDDLRIMRDEVFGPLLPIRTYRTFDEAVHFIAERPHPLALYYFGENEREIETLLNATNSGGVAINDVIMQYTMDDLPFGGVGASGMGAYHGFDGFKRFSHARAVYQQSPIDIGGMLRPPYGPRFRKVARFLLNHG